MRVIYVRLFVFVAQGIDMADAFTGKFAVFVGIVLDMGVNVMRDRIEAVGCGIGKFGGTDLFECTRKDIDVFEVLDLQAGGSRFFAFEGKRLFFDTTGELCAHRLVFFALKVAASEDDVGQLRVLYVKADTEERGA